jgi:hypothetical protein
MEIVQEKTRRVMSRKDVENSTFVSDWLIRNIRPFKLVKSIWKLIEVYKDLPRDEWKKLFKAGYAEEYQLTEDEVIEILKSKTPQFFPGATKYCHWCKGTSCILHEHHYPVKKSKGGQETINICPSCHSEFHFLSDNKQYRLTKRIQDEIQSCRQERLDALKTFEEV